MRHYTTLLFALLAVSYSVHSTPLGCKGESLENLVKTPLLVPQVLASKPHDKTRFTQGLVIEQDRIYESTGNYGKSKIFKSDLDSGRVLSKKSLHKKYFGEGLTLWGDKLYHITYKSRRGFVYDKLSLKTTRRFKLFGSGWGITHNNQHLIISDGTENLAFFDPDTLQPVKEIEVYDEGKPLKRLNELEYINGFLLANVWQTNLIAIINPASGQTIAKIDLSNVVAKQSSNKKASVLNGIAYDSVKDALWVTGKYWTELYQVCLKKVETEAV